MLWSAPMPSKNHKHFARSRERKGTCWKRADPRHRSFGGCRTPFQRWAALPQDARKWTEGSEATIWAMCGSDGHSYVCVIWSLKCGRWWWYREPALPSLRLGQDGSNAGTLCMVWLHKSITCSEKTWIIPVVTLCEGEFETIMFFRDEGGDRGLTDALL